MKRLILLNKMKKLVIAIVEEENKKSEIINLSRLLIFLRLNKSHS